MRLPLFITNNKKLVLIILIGILVIGNVFFIARCILSQREIKEKQQELEEKKTDLKVLNFLSLFIDKVLKASGEVSFDDRLKLENSVRELQDEEVLTQWESFTGAATETQVQQEVKNLLEMLVKKVMY